MISDSCSDEEDNGGKKKCKRHPKNTKHTFGQRSSSFRGVTKYVYVCLFCIVIILHLHKVI